MTLRILVDECLSPTLVAIAKARGHDATHIVWIGKAGVQDWNLIPVIVDGDYLFVTNDHRGFRRLYAEVEVHNGLVVVLPNVGRLEQVRLFTLALDAAESLDSTVNKLIEVDFEGRIAIDEWPRAG